MSEILTVVVFCVMLLSGSLAYAQDNKVGDNWVEISHKDSAFIATGNRDKDSFMIGFNENFDLKSIVLTDKACNPNMLYTANLSMGNFHKKIGDLQCEVADIRDSKISYKLTFLSKDMQAVMNALPTEGNLIIKMPINQQKDYPFETIEISLKGGMNAFLWFTKEITKRS